MEPRVTRREKKLHLTYELKHRVRCSAILTSPSPNNSTILFHGHDAGLTLSWRGGERVRKASAVTGDHESATGEPGSHEEELDLDNQFPSIHQALEIPLDSPVAKIALLEQPGLRKGSSQTIKVVVATLDGCIRLLTVPLQYPDGNQIPRVQTTVAEDAIVLRTAGSYVHCLAGKIVQANEPYLTVSAGIDQLEVWRMPVDVVSEEDIQHFVTPHTGLLSSLSYHPGPQSERILVVNKFGSVDTYSESDGAGFLLKDYTFTTPFEASEIATPHRSRLVDARFILGGRCVFALMYDGRWGIWDTAGQSGTATEDFVLSGYLDAAVANMMPDASRQKTASSMLTPMTPNTRKTKTETFFSAPQPRRPDAAPTGGITVSRSVNSSGIADESVMIWFQSNIYTIPSIQAFWQRSTNGSGGLGSLHNPGIASVLGINLFNETITSLSQFQPSNTIAGIGQLKTQRDFLLSTEHRLIIVQGHSSSRSAFTQALTQHADTRDQRMLDAGDLDLGGVERLLDGMNGRSRKVGFAH